VGFLFKMLHLDSRGRISLEMVNREEKVQGIETTFNGLLKKYFGSEKVQVNLANAPTVRSLLDNLCNSSEHHQRVFDAHGEVKSDITILKNGRNIVFLEGLDTKLNEGDKIAIFPPICGG